MTVQLTTVQDFPLAPVTAFLPENSFYLQVETGGFGWLLGKVLRLVQENQRQFSLSFHTEYCPWRCTGFPPESRSRVAVQIFAGGSKLPKPFFTDTMGTERSSGKLPRQN